MSKRWYTAGMAKKKKTKKNLKKSKRVAGKKKAPAKKAVGKKLAKKRVTPKKKVVKKRAAAKRAKARKKRVRGKSESVNTVASPVEGQRARSGGQAGDLQGLSDRESADSESVDELLEEGNAFEAEVVKGVEDAGDADRGEVHTHEEPEDDVPGEYRDKD
jgi:hypothetical protein